MQYYKVSEIKVYQNSAKISYTSISEHMDIHIYVRPMSNVFEIIYSGNKCHCCDRPSTVDQLIEILSIFLEKNQVESINELVYTVIADK